MSKILKSICTIQYNKDKFQSKLGKIFKSTPKYSKVPKNYPKVSKSTQKYQQKKCLKVQKVIQNFLVLAQTLIQGSDLVGLLQAPRLVLQARPVALRVPMLLMRLYQSEQAWKPFRTTATIISLIFPIKIKN